MLAWRERLWWADGEQWAKTIFKRTVWKKAWTKNVHHVSLCPFFFFLVLTISKLCCLCWPTASLWLSKIGQVKRDSRASLIQFDRTAGCSEFDQLIKWEQRNCPPSVPLKAVHVPVSLPYLFYYAAALIKIKYMFWVGKGPYCTSSSSFTARIKQQAECSTARFSCVEQLFSNILFRMCWGWNMSIMNLSSSWE